MHASGLLRVAAAGATAVALLGTLSACRDLGPGADANGAKSSAVVYSVTGHGSAQIQYAAYGDSRMTTVPKAALPWSVQVNTVDHSQTVYQVLVSGGLDPGCSISVNGVTVVQQGTETKSGMLCTFTK